VTATTGTTPPSTVRVDARDKVTGAVRYGTDRVPPGLLHAALAVATVAKGRIVRLDTEAAAAVPGVHLVLTHVDAGELGSGGFLLGGGYGFQSFQPLMADRIAYRGQPIALVVADTLHVATEAATLVQRTRRLHPRRTRRRNPRAVRGDPVADVRRCRHG
jgi:xanthine dehydrogenase YagR molybdenum-binding subunit